MSREHCTRLPDILARRAEVLTNLLELFEELRAQERQRVNGHRQAVLDNEPDQRLIGIHEQLTAEKDA